MTIRIEEGPGPSGPCLPGGHDWEELEYDGEWPERPYECWRCGIHMEILSREEAEESWEWIEEWFVTSWIEAKYPKVFDMPAHELQAVDEPRR